MTLCVGDDRATVSTSGRSIPLAGARTSAPRGLRATAGRPRAVRSGRRRRGRKAGLWAPKTSSPLRLGRTSQPAALRARPGRWKEAKKRGEWSGEDPIAEDAFESGSRVLRRRQAQVLCCVAIELWKLAFFRNLSGAFEDVFARRCGRAFRVRLLAVAMPDQRSCCHFRCWHTFPRPQDRGRGSDDPRCPRVARPCPDCRARLRHWQ